MAGIEEHAMVFHDPKECGGIITGERGSRRCAECGRGIPDREIASAYHEFSEANQAQLLTAVSNECNAGDCARCPGMLEEPGAAPVFCVHPCHRSPEIGRYSFTFVRRF